MRVTRTLTYESDDEERLVAVLQRSLGLGVHQFGSLKIVVSPVEGPSIEGVYPSVTRSGLNYDRPLDLIGRLKFQALTHPPTADCPDVECLICGVRDCPHGEPMHHHHDGCPACDRTDDDAKNGKAGGAVLLADYVIDEGRTQVNPRGDRDARGEEDAGGPAVSAEPAGDHAEYDPDLAAR